MFRATVALLLWLTATIAPAAPLADELEAIRSRFDISAVSWARVEGDRVVELGGLGFHSREQQRPVSADSLFRVGSLTKLVTALSLHMLAEQGKLDLDAPLRRYLPDVPLQNHYNTPITLRMVLEHSAGLHDLTHTEFDYPAPLSLSAAFQVAPEARFTAWQPGLHQSYSNVGAGYAGLALERITGEDWDRWVSRKLLTPLAMQHSSTRYSPRLQQKLVTGYDTDRRSVLPYWHTLFRPFGALNTTARDFSQLLKLLINRGQHNGQTLLSSDSITQMEAPRSTVAAGMGHDYGYGAGLYRWYRNQKLLLGHGGDGDGYLAHFAYSPDSRRGIFVVINAFHHPALRAMRKPLEEWVIAPLPAPKPTTATMKTEQLSQLTGNWQAVSQRFPQRSHSPAEVTIELEDGVLRYRQGSRRTALVPVAENRFREENEGGATHLFFEWGRKWYWQSDLGNFRHQP